MSLPASVLAVILILALSDCPSMISLFPAGNIPAIAPLIQSSHDLEMAVDPHSHARTVVLAIVLIPETAPLVSQYCHG